MDQLEGTDEARVRLKAILETLAGQLGITEAAARLGLTPQRVHMLREQALEAALAALATQPLGRPPSAPASEQEQIDGLRQENERLQRQVAASKLREEVALVLPRRKRRGEKKRRNTSER